MARRSIGTLTLDLILRAGGFQQGMDQAARLAEDRSRRIERSMRGLKTAMAGAFAALGGAAIFREVIQSTIESENALRQLEQRILSTSGAAQKTARELTAYATELQRASVFDDEAIVNAQTALLSFTNIAGPTFDRTTRAALDLSTALGQDLTSAARTLGIALNDPERGLARLARSGIQLDEAQRDLIKSLAESGRVVEAQNLLLSELEERYGGSAAAAADTFGGALKQVKNAFGDLLEAPGGMDDAKTALQSFRDLLMEPETIAAAQSLTTGLVTGVAAATNAINDLIEGWQLFGAEYRQFFGNSTARDEMVLINRDIAEAQANLDNLRGPLVGTPELIAHWTAEIERLIRARERLERGARGPGSVSGIIQRPEPPAPTGPKLELVSPSDDFIKLREQLEQQIALYGKSGEAAKLAYQLQIGALEEVSAEEGEQLVRLAQQYDALVQNSVAAKEFAEENKRAAQEAESLRAQLEGQLESVRQFTLSRSEIELEAHAGRLETLRESLEAGLILEDEFRALSIAAAAETARTISDIQLSEGKRAADELLSIEQGYQDELAWLRQQGADLAIGLLARFGEENKAFAVAAIGVQTALAAKSILLSSRKAAMAAFEPPPIGLGPVFGGPLSASLLAAGKLSAGLTAAIGAMDIFRTLKPPESSHTSAGTQLRSASEAASTLTPRTQSEDENRRQHVTQVQFLGDFYGWDYHIEQNVMNGLRRAFDRDFVVIRGDTTQAYEIARIAKR